VSWIDCSTDFVRHKLLIDGLSTTRLDWSVSGR